MNFGGCLFLPARRLVCGPVERRLCDFCLCLSSGVDKRRAVLLPVLLSCLEGLGETCEDLRKESVLHVVFADSKSERLLTLTNTLTTRRSTLVYGIG